MEYYNFIKDGQIQFAGPLDEENKKFEGFWCLNSEIDFEKYNKGYDIFKENGEIVYKLNKDRKQKIEEKQLQIEKQEKLNKIKEISELSANLRAKYLSAELLPDGEIKTATLEKLAEKTEPLSLEFQSLIGEFIRKYNENSLELIL